MNKIYKVIYSKVRNCYVVVSELAKNNGKGTSRGAVVGSPKRTSLLAAVLAAGVMAFGALPGIAAAADPAIVNDGKNILSTDAKFKDEIAEDPGTFPEGGGQSIAIGKDAYAFMQGGSKASLMRFGEKKVTGSIAIGEGAQALSQSIAIGNRVYTGDLGDVTISTYKNALSGAGVGSVLLGSNSYTGGTLSTLMGDYSIISTSYPNNSRWSFSQNAGAVSIGALNSIESAMASSTSGIANSIVGLANRTNNANGALIYGAGNEITNSIGYASAPTSGSSAKAAVDSLRRSVKTSPGGAVLAIGGGNTADWVQSSQLMGVNNTLKGTQKSVSKYNLIDGYKNTGTNISNSKIIGSSNTLNEGASSNTIIGDQHTLAAAKVNNVILGNADKELTTSVSNAVLLGHNADVQKDGGVAVGDSSVATTDKGIVGFDLKGENHSSDTTGTWKSTAAAVSVGDVANKLTRQITNVAAGTEDTDAVNVAQLKQARTKYYSVNEKAPNVFGDAAKEYAQYLNDDNKGAKEFAGLAAGYMTYAGGIASTVTGSFSGIMNEAVQPGSNDFRGAAALSYGTFNLNDNTSASQPFSGVANSIVGQANVTTDSNAALIYGAGNSVTNSYRAIDASKAGAILQNLKDPKKLNEALKAAVPTSGAQVMVMGGGNTVDQAYMTQVVGVGNTVKGSDKEYAEGTSTQLNYVDGFYNTVENGKNDYVIGSHNILTGSSVDTNKSNLVLGDNHKLTDRKNNVIVGSADKELTTSASDAVLIGHNADVKVDGGVALGSESVATVDKGVEGYDPKAEDHSSDTTGTWKATAAAVSVGNKEKNLTRQITGVAAGTADTDAVNVAQLKQVNTAVAANKVHYYSVNSKLTDDKSNYNNDGAKAEESMVIGIGSSSEALYSTVIGTSNTAKKWGTTKASGMYDTVVGQYLNTNGSYNSVFGTYYEGLQGNQHVQVLTEVYGDRNTVLGVGNQVGNKNHKSDENTVIGVKNQVEGNGSIVVGNATTVHGQDVMNGTSFGHVNTIYDKKEGGGQWGVALGNKLTVKGENALAAGTESTAEGYDAVAIGHSAVTSGEYALAMGSGSSAATQGTAIGGYGANAKAGGSVALGSFSVADRAAGEKVGYDPSTKAASTDTSSTWKSNLAAVSVGDATNGYTRQITNVAAGSEDTDAVNVAQLKKAVAGAKDGNDTLVSNDNALSLNGKQLSMNIKDTAGNTVSGSVDLSKIAAAVDTNTTYTLDGKDNGDNTTTISLKDNDGNASGTITVATKDTRNTVEAGENVTLDTKDNADGSHIYKVNVKADGKVAAGDTKLVSGDTVYNETRVQQDGTYVKQSNTAGQNLSALDNQVANNSSSINRLNGRVNDLDSRINKVGAGAAALAALHPQDFNPDDKWDFAVGYGNYRDANAMAIGAFYRPDENVMFSMGTNFGNGENMVNAGVTFKLGPKNHTTSNKYLLSKEVTTLRATVAQQDAQLKQQSSEIKELREMVSKLLAKK